MPACFVGKDIGLSPICMNTCICSWHVLSFKPDCNVHRLAQVKAFLADPSAFVVEAAPEAAAGGGGGGGAAEAKEEAKEEEKKEEEEEEDEDMGFSLFD